MKNLLRLEELAQFVLCLVSLITNNVARWWYALLFIGPDISMLGDLVNTKVGSVTYDLFHHKAVGIALIVIGVYRYIGATLASLFSDTELDSNTIMIVGSVIYGHASMDRIFGYGLKFGDSFQHTHLGWIGKGRKEQATEAGRKAS